MAQAGQAGAADANGRPGLPDLAGLADLAGPAAPAAADAAPWPVAVVIVAHNSGPKLVDAVRAALAERPRELVVVDNASADGCCAFLAAAAAAPTRVGTTQVRGLRLERNVGFAQGSNVGVGATTAPYVLFVNDDCLLRPGYLRTLVAALHQTPQAASATGKIVYRAGAVTHVDSAGVRLDRLALRPQDRGQDAVDCGQYDAPGEIFGPTGAAALYRRKALAAAGGFRAELFAYYEDVDLAWRLGRQGWRHLYVPQAVAEHRRRGPAGKPRAIEAKAFVNRYEVWLANESLPRLCAYAPVALSWEAVRLARLALRRPRFAAAVLRRTPGACRRGWRRRRTDASASH